MEPLNLKAKLFRGFSAPTRLAILESLKDVEKTGSEVASLIGQSQTNVSNHLIYLLECGLVKKRRDGKRIYYSIKDWRFLRFLSDSDAILAEGRRSSSVRSS
ncbi:MAG: metalloregulator ArsR/SmtB family transcription factor [Thaumarchaeota archaeon]|nr:metalloregulator ArsR/SmtB family transcription factor [Nitrososphaerota archaeon]